MLNEDATKLFVRYLYASSPYSYFFEEQNGKIEFLNYQPIHAIDCAENLEYYIHNYPLGNIIIYRWQI